MANKVGEKAPKTGLYWCTVCKLPAAFQKGDTLPACKNKCGRGTWEYVRDLPEQGANGGSPA